MAKVHSNNEFVKITQHAQYPSSHNNYSLQIYHAGIDEAIRTYQQLYWGTNQQQMPQLATVCNQLWPTSQIHDLQW